MYVCVGVCEWAWVGGLGGVGVRRVFVTVEGHRRKKSLKTTRDEEVDWHISCISPVSQFNLRRRRSS